MQIVKVTLDESEMDSFVFFLANKKVMSKMHKEMLDLVSFVCQLRVPTAHQPTTAVVSSFQCFQNMNLAKLCACPQTGHAHTHTHTHTHTVPQITRTHAETHLACFPQSLFCNEKKSVEKLGLPSSFQLLSEIGEATSTILDTKVGSRV